MVRCLIIGLILLLQATFVSSEISTDGSEHVTSGVCQWHGRTQSSPPQPLLSPGPEDEIFSGVEALTLYSVTDGNLLKSTLTQQQLKTQSSITIEGHVCGIVIVCKKEMAVRVDGKEASRIKRNADGTCFIKFKGRMKAEQVGLPSHPGSGEKRLSEGRAVGQGEDYFPGAYSFFPRITGDMVSSSDEFEIGLEAEGKKTSILVRQIGYQTVHTVCRDSECQGDGIIFRHAGAALDQAEKESEDFQARFHAITEGIGNVERTFGVKLVSYINIIEYQNLKNAVTCDEGREIWFYAEAFRKEPLNELKVIAEHEALHKLVSGMKLTASSDVRELFSDITGYGEFSNERFMIMMSGFIRPEAVREKPEINLFFSFINERNFLEGVKGGHSHESLEEFCASFLHSLMSIDRLDRSLSYGIKPYGNSASPRVLTYDEKAETLDVYIRTIETLIQALPESQDEDQTIFLSPDQAESFLKACLMKARNVRRHWLMTREEAGWEDGSLMRTGKAVLFPLSSLYF